MNYTPAPQTIELAREFFATTPPLVVDRTTRDDAQLDAMSNEELETELHAISNAHEALTIQFSGIIEELAAAKGESPQKTLARQKAERIRFAALKASLT